MGSLGKESGPVFSALHILYLVRGLTPHTHNVRSKEVSFAQIFSNNHCKRAICTLSLVFYHSSWQNRNVLNAPAPLRKVLLSPPAAPHEKRGASSEG